MRATRLAGLLGTIAALLASPAWVLWPLPTTIEARLPGGPGLEHSLTVATWQALAEGGPLELVHHGGLQQPFGVDLFARGGLPLDALVGVPLVDLLGWAPGMGVAAWLILALVGLAAAALGTHATGSRSAGLLAGLTWQASGLAALSLSSGRLDQLLGMALLPAALLAWSQALEGRGSAAIRAGLLATLLLLSWSHGAVIFGVFALLLAGSAWGRGLSLGAPLRTAGLAAFALGLVPLSWLGSQAWLRPGSRGEGVDLVSGLVTGAEVATSRSILGGLDPTWPPLPTAVAGILGLALAWRLGRGRSLVAPVLVAVGSLVCLLLALGPTTVPAPTSLLLALPGRIWSPGVLLGGLELGLCLLAAWTVTVLPPRLRPVGALLLGGLALAARPGPLPTTPFPWRGGGFLEVEGPVVWVPSPGGPEDPLATALLDRAWHGLALVDPPVPPDVQWDTDPVARGLHRRYGALDQLLRLGEEGADDPLTPESLGLLVDAGATAVVVDHDALDEAGEGGDRIRERLSLVLGPRVPGERYQVVALSGRSDAPGGAPPPSPR